MTTLQDLVASANATVKSYTVDEARAHLDDPDVAFVDVRDRPELDETGTIPGAVHASRGLLEFHVDPGSPYHLDVFDSGKELVFVCKSGGRSALAARRAQEMGVGRVASLAGGMLAWHGGGGPVRPSSPATTSQRPPEGARPARGAKVTVRGQGDALGVLGDAQRVKLTGDDTGGRFTLIENENPPGTTLPVHLHRNEDEAFYVVEGRVEFDVAGDRVVGEPGATVFLPRGVPHTWRVVGEGPARMLIMLTPAGLEGYFRELSALPTDGPPDMGRVLEISERYGIEFPGLQGGPSTA